MSAIRDKVERSIAQIEARPQACVFTRLYTDQAREDADAADARHRHGMRLSPLDGTIVSIKDLFDVAGEPTRAGSTFLSKAVAAAHDATVVARLRRAGALIIGKTNMSEFAFSGLGLNPHYGTPGNAIDPARIPGGSSSGAGVSVAEGTSEISIGTDTGGSVRIPAAFNGIVGFKPTARRVPTKGAFPLSYTLDSIGPLARTVQQCADADAVMAGEEPSEVVPFPLNNLRIGVPRGIMLDDVDPAVGAAFDGQLKKLAQHGVRFVDVHVDDLVDAMRQAISVAPIASIEAAAIHQPWLEHYAAAYDQRVLRRIQAGSSIPAPIFVRTMRARNDLIAGMDRRLAPLDALMMPTVPIVAPLTKPLLDDDDVFTRVNLQVLRNPSFGNLFDLTGISLPAPVSGLPVGIMLLARQLHDSKLLSMAKSIQALSAT